MNKTLFTCAVLAVGINAAKISTSMDMQSASLKAERPNAGLNVAYYTRTDEEVTAKKTWSKVPDFDKYTAFKVDVIADVNNKAGSGKVLTSGLADHVAVDITGFIDIPEHGDWTFWTNSDDGSRLYIDGEEIVDNDGLHGDRQKSGKLHLQKGAHAFRTTMFERGGGATIQAFAEGPSFKKALIPKAWFSTQEEEKCQPGLWTKIYKGVPGGLVKDLSDRKPDQEFAEKTIDWNVGAAPYHGNLDNFQVISSGFFLANEPGEYTFGITSDDGSKLWIDGKEVIDNNSLHGMREKQAKVTLDAGYHSIKAHQAENGGWAGLKLKVGSNKLDYQVIPEALLSHGGCEDKFEGRPAEDIDLENIAPGIKVSYYGRNKGENRWNKVPDFKDRKPLRTDVLPKIDNTARGGNVLTSGMNEDVAAVMEGFIYCPEDGVWTLGTTSDDGSKLYIGDELVVDNDGLHGDRLKKGDIAVHKGWHKIRVEMFEKGGWATIKVHAGNQDHDFGIVPEEAWGHYPEKEECFAGLDAAIYTGFGNLGKLPELKGKPAIRFVSDVVDWSVKDKSFHGISDRFAVAYNGYIDIPHAGEWKFGIESDDGSKLWIDDELIADNDGNHGMREKSGKRVLEAGLHKVRAEMYENGGWAGCKIRAGSDQHEYSIVPADMWSHGECKAKKQCIPGVHTALYKDMKNDKLPNFEEFKADAEWISEDINWDAKSGSFNNMAADNFGVVYSGFIDIPVAGNYQIGTLSDDGSKVWINGEVLVDNDGLHGARDKSAWTELKAGKVEFRAEMFEKGGAASMQLKFGKKGDKYAVIPSDRLFHGDC